jgi:hypothetical protein
MKKTLFVALFLMLGIGFQAQAVSTNSNQGNKTGQALDVEASAGSQSGNAVQNQEQNKVMNQGENTQIQTQEQSAVQIKDKSKDSKGQLNGASHRSVVATFVQSLLSVADREGGIGQEVRAIAQQQNVAKDRASDLINAVESRNKVKTFFIGTSYQNLGELQSQMVQTRNQLEQLKQLAAKVENEEDKTQLQNQIQTLEQEQTRINDFITKNESKFSLFCWAVKLFRG